MDFKTITTSSNKVIDVYDNLFSFKEREGFYTFITHSYFLTKGWDGFYENTNHQIYAAYSVEDVNTSNFFNFSGYKFLEEKYNLVNKEAEYYRVNCSNCFERSTPHTDSFGISFIYYVNLNWDNFWGGHTLFFNESLTEIDYTCLAKPGRVVVFDGSIPHCISPISTSCRNHRYSFVIQYK